MPVLPPSDMVPATPKYNQISASQVGIDGIDRTADQGEGNYEVPADHALVIQPGGEDDLLAYAMYALTDLNTERPVEADFSIAAAPIQPGGEEDLPLSFWVGISDFTTYSWEWHGPYTSPDNTVNVDLNELVGGQDIRDRYISAANVLYMVVLTEAGPDFVGPGNPLGLTAARINLLTVNKLTVGELGYRSTRPHFPLIESIGVAGAEASDAKQAAALDPSQYVTLTWTHVFDVNDPDSEAIQYKVYRKGPDDASMIPIGSVNAPEQQYIDPTNNASWVPEVVPGATYTYYLRAYNNAGFTPFSDEEYLIPVINPDLFPPINFAGVYDDALDRITLTWEMADNAIGYEICRDAQDQPLVMVNDGQSEAWIDDNLVGNWFYTYWIRTAGAGGAFSTFSEPIIVYAALDLAPDTLYAIPEQTALSVGETATVFVMTGETANPFQFMDMISVTVENGASYVANSFDYGSPSPSDQHAVDGAWTAMSPAGGLLWIPDNFIWEGDIGGGRKRIEFTIAPMGGSDCVNFSGMLFSFQLSFNAAGTYTLGFQQSTGTVNRTYYTQADETAFFWGDISNDHAGIHNSITVE